VYEGELMDDLLAQPPGPQPPGSGSGPRPGPGGPETEAPAGTAAASRPGASAGRAAGRGSRLARRRRVLLGVAVGAALLAIGGLIGATFIKSPAQLAADTAPPAPTVTTAKVTSQDLTSSVAMRGVVYPSTQYDVSASGTAAQLYISKLDVKAGGTVRNGELIAEIDGAPMFVLSGSVPAWRDLAPGETGPDVAELQKALAALGYSDEGDTSGYYGVGTEDAVSAFYQHLGYTVPTAATASGTGTGTGAGAGATGPQVPQGDVLFLPSLPATVIAVNGAVGQQAGSPFLELSAGGALTLTGELPPSYASQIKTGLKVQIYDQATGIRAAGTVAALSTATQTLPVGTTVDIGGSSSAGSSGSSGTSGSSGSSGSSASSGASSGSGDTGSGSGSSLFVPVTVTPSAPLPAALNGENVLVTVETGQTEGPVLTVPVAAIVTTASGQSSVTVVAAGGKQTKVPVTPGLSANGYVQVTPVTAGALAAGDTVVVSG
jgi:HlyD family secretion protein